MRRSTWVLGALALLLTLPSAFAQAEDPDAYGDDYRSGDFGRLRYQDNGVTLLRAESNEPQPEAGATTVNAPIFPGDSLRTARGQRAEVQLPSGTLVRVGEVSDLTFESLPRPDAKYQDNTVLRLASGTIRISARVRDGDDFRVDTPSASVYLLGDGDVRIEAEANGPSRVTSRRGVVEVVGEGGSVLVRGGMRSVVDLGSIPSDPRAFNTAVFDPFDRWCAVRDESYRAQEPYARRSEDDREDAVVYERIPVEVRPYYAELNHYGRWVYASDYGYVWYPDDVGAGWRPYYHGYWDYGPGGYFWVGNEPWGWAPYHYGRWNWMTGFGWCWVPGRVFGGAWVSWSWGSVYLGWCPLDFWGGPAYYGAYYHGYYDPHCWTFVDYDHIGSRDYPRHAVPVERAGTTLRNNAVVTRPPRIPPHRLARDVSARERAAREAREDRAAHIRPISRDRNPERKFRTVEDRLIERGATRTWSRTGRGSTDENAVPGAAKTPSSDVPSWRRSRQTPGASDRGRAEPPPATPEDRKKPGRSRTTDEADSPARQNAGRGRSVQPRSAVSSVRDEGWRERRSLQMPRERSQANTQERVRDMYQRLSRPQQTQERGEARRASSPSSDARPVDRRAAPPAVRNNPPGPQAPKAQPRPQPRSEPSQPRQTGRESGSSRDKGQGKKK